MKEIQLINKKYIMITGCQYEQNMCSQRGVVKLFSIFKRNECRKNSTKY